MYRHTDSPNRHFRDEITSPYIGWIALAMAIYGNPDGEAPDWHRHAACAGTSHEPWFPPDGAKSGNPARKHRYLRETYCDHCPVQQQCYDDTVQWESRWTAGGGQVHGFVAGASGPQRYATIHTTNTSEDAA
ncbi:hypothetical protein FHX42_005295 [Saccharopolyspora lacisalsi]|uniref:4Fe-4S Wbl-type domain-containing protein n=1 Tax=Halosaccharopolyspora lacisalsi TaxID=1000566 RepID=A0A839EAL9_9PSEU|nr:WhiB family transcriptional regulator [Halosaccharopolyspora lacisalsi]MBA8827888.1 hypothetical protein [Halosaccharopolyspora lacisalsi]